MSLADCGPSGSSGAAELAAGTKSEGSGGIAAPRHARILGRYLSGKTTNRQESGARSVEAKFTHGGEGTRGLCGTRRAAGATAFRSRREDGRAAKVGLSPVMYGPPLSAAPRRATSACRSRKLGFAPVDEARELEVALLLRAVIAQRLRPLRDRLRRLRLRRLHLPAATKRRHRLSQAKGVLSVGR